MGARAWPAAAVSGRGGGGAARADDAADPARVWVVGAACRELLGSPSDEDADDLIEQIGRSLAPLVGRGWELRGGPAHRFVLARGRAAGEISVEVVVEPLSTVG